jgi:DUF1680 family protein
MYLYCGMADVAALKNDTGYIDALNRIWDNLIYKNMYVTGGIGSSRHNEGFTEDYDLPNEEAYCETCASVGMVYWNQRMNQFTGNAKYIDVLERSMYNGALAGVSLSGDRFFYVNPLESKGKHHRQEWYGCACCPSQVSRFLPSIGNYIYGISQDAVWVNLYIGNEAEIPDGSSIIKVKQETDYPWNGLVKFTILSPTNKDIRLRLPNWAKSHEIKVNGSPAGYTTDKGYAVLKGEWKINDVIELNMPMTVEIVAANPNVKADAGKRAVQRGPLLYCIEEIDNKAVYNKSSLNPASKFENSFRTDLLNGIIEVKTPILDGGEIKFIPYYTWDNRDAGQMKVWIDYKE